MTNIIIYFAIFSVIVLLMAVTLYSRRKSDYASAIESHPEATQHIPAMTEAEASTRKLIGDSAYEKMVKRVDRVLSRHSSDRCMSVPMTCGPESKRGWSELNSLLPGDPLWLRQSMDAAHPCVEIYSGGYRIGKILDDDAVSIIPVIHSHELTGAYVAEQNSYGDSDVASMRIILFFRLSEAKRHLDTENVFSDSYRIDIPGYDHHIRLCQN